MGGASITKNKINQQKSSMTNKYNFSTRGDSQVTFIGPSQMLPSSSVM